MKARNGKTRAVMQKKFYSERVHSAWAQTQNISLIIKNKILFYLYSNIFFRTFLSSVNIFSEKKKKINVNIASKFHEDKVT